MQRTFHARIRWQHWLLLAVLLFVAVHAVWSRHALLIAGALLLLTLVIDRMIHTTYTVTQEALVVHTSRFAKDRVVPLADIERIDRVERMRLMGRSLSSCLLVVYGGGRLLPVIPQNEDDFVSVITKRRNQHEED